MQMYVNETYNIQDQTNSCYLHPDEKFVGVCPLCLNERLVSLAYVSRQTFHCFRGRSFKFCNGDDGGMFSCGHGGDGGGGKRDVLKKSFSMSSGIFQHFEFRQRNKAAGEFGGADIDESVSTSSQEESYITIKIDEEAFATLEKNNNTKKNIIKSADDEVKKAPETEHVNQIIQEKMNSTPATTTTLDSGKRLSWHSCIGQLIKKKETMRGWICHSSIDKVAEGVEVKKCGWIRRIFGKRKE